MKGRDGGTKNKGKERYTKEPRRNLKILTQISLNGFERKFFDYETRR